MVFRRGLRRQRPESRNQHVRAGPNQFCDQLRQSLRSSIGGTLIEPGQPGSLSCRDNFISALAELGMGPRDIPANINFFMHVPVDGEGHVAITDGISKPGDYVDLRCERDVLVVISNCPRNSTPVPAEIRHLFNWRSGGRPSSRSSHVVFLCALHGPGGLLMIFGLLPPSVHPLGQRG
jgi:hypothetical protein